MTDETPRNAVPAAGRVPTLTEVIDAAGPQGWRAASRRRFEAPASDTAAARVGHAQALSPADDPPSGEDDRLRHALAAALARFDADADARLRHALQPILAEATDRLVAAARTELASSLRDLLAGSIAPDRTAPPDRRSADSSSV